MKKVKNKCNRPHKRKFFEGGKKNFVFHFADIKSCVVANHGINHKEHHDNRKNNFLKFSFWHKKSPL